MGISWRGVGAVMVVCAGPAHAQTSPSTVPSEDYAHEGFYLRLSLDPGWMHLSKPYTTLNGFAIGPTLAIGGSVAKNLIVHAQLFFDDAPSPKDSSGGWPGLALMVGVGAGLTYYFMPLSFYVSGGIARAKLLAGDGQEYFLSGWGWAASFMVGHDWRTGPRSGVGLGIGARFGGGLSFGTQDWSTRLLSLVGSFTFG